MKMQSKQESMQEKEEVKSSKEESYTLSIRTELIQGGLLVKSIISGADLTSRIYQEEMKLNKLLLQMTDSSLVSAIWSKQNHEIQVISREMSGSLPQSVPYRTSILLMLLHSL